MDARGLVVMLFSIIMLHHISVILTFLLLDLRTCLFTQPFTYACTLISVNKTRKRVHTLLSPCKNEGPKSWDRKDILNQGTATPGTKYESSKDGDKEWKARGTEPTEDRKGESISTGTNDLDRGADGTDWRRMLSRVECAAHCETGRSTKEVVAVHQMFIRC